MPAQVAGRDNGIGPSRQALGLVQASRGVAALSVAALHFTLIEAPNKFDRWLEFGRLGVDYFFVLSGFIILYAHSSDINRPERLRAYLSKRVARIYPIYWFVIALVSGHMLLRAELDLGFLDWLATFSLLRFSAHPTPIPVAWTLFHEILFYGLFATLIYNRRLGVALFAGWLGLILVFARDPWDGFTAFNTLAAVYNLNFILGMCVYLLSGRSSSSRVMSLATIGAAFSGIAALVLWERWYSEAPQAAYGLLFAAMLWGLVRLDQLGTCVPYILRLLGDASFAIYLTHIVTIRICDKAIVDPLGISDGPGLLVCLGFASAVGIVLHVLLERPVLTALRSKSGNGPPKEELFIAGADYGTNRAG